MATTKQHDLLNRLTGISSVSSVSSVVNFSYAYNAANQRTRRTETDGSYWSYAHDPLGQLKSSKRFWSDMTPVAGQQFEYPFDDIGNRTSTKTGGDAGGGSLRLANHIANRLNQYTSRDVPGYLNVLGLSFATNSVTVNGQAPSRRGEYFQAQLFIDNTSAPVWTNIIVSAPGQSSVSGSLLLAKAAETFTFDDDGNLTSDSLERVKPLYFR